MPEKNRVTMLWLDVSSDGGEPCRVNANDKSQLLLRPLPHSLPLPGADKIRCVRAPSTASVCGNAADVLAKLPHTPRVVSARLQMLIIDDAGKGQASAVVFSLPDVLWLAG